MPTLLLTSLMAFVLALGFTPALRLALLQGQTLEHSRRRRQAAPGTSQTPRLGGLAVLAAVAVALWLRAAAHLPYAGRASQPILQQLGGPVLLILLLGAADDWFNLAPVWKFTGQIAAAAWVVGNGLRVSAVLYHPLPGWLSATITIVWLVGCCNAFNLIDGLDGLATGLALFATGTVLAHAVLIGEPGLALIMGTLFGALAAFLLFNFPPASIYLGDCGSLAIGFLLGGTALAWANKATTAVGLLAPLLAVFIPVLDTGVAIVRRTLSGQPVFGRDQHHIHHRLLRHGLTPRYAVLLLYGLAGLGAVAALLLADRHQHHSFELVILLFAVLPAASVYLLGYDEFSPTGRLVWRGWSDPRRRAQSLLLRECSEAIAVAAGYDQVWDHLCRACRSLELQGLELRVGTAARPLWQRSVCWGEAGAMSPSQDGFRGWVGRIPLGDRGDSGVLVLWRDFGGSHPGSVDEIVHLLGDPLGRRLQEIQLDPGKAFAATSGQ